MKNNLHSDRIAAPRKLRVIAARPDLHTRAQDSAVLLVLVCAVCAALSLLLPFS